MGKSLLFQCLSNSRVPFFASYPLFSPRIQSNIKSLRWQSTHRRHLKKACLSPCRRQFVILTILWRLWFLKPYRLCSNSISKSKIMFYKDHSRRKFSNQIFNLHSRINVNIVERFVPYIQMRLLAKAFCYQYFFSFVPPKNLPLSF